MTAERWQRVKELFETARQASVAERERLLTDSGDLELAQEVRDLLAAHDESSDFLETSAIESHLPTPFAGTRIGPYQLTRQLGEGGMGVVCEAVRADGQFEQTVAIKILKRWMMSEEDTTRFRAERQILAGLKHPNIARLLDGGTTSDGMPYYAMELVDGEFLDAYCRNRNLSVADRLQLFRKVCDAVGYAHERGVVHRDLKPANILVERDGTPKLLDFGIAKLQANGLDTPRTATVNRIATPLYASPEQLQGNPITPASDIYSLGVLLYELLVGENPFHHAGGQLHQVAQTICEGEPEAPGKRRSLPGGRGPVTVGAGWSSDLDDIVLMAMRKLPKERYATAGELSADLARYLDRVPVVARSGRVGRRAGRMLRKVWRPALITAGCAALMAVSWSRFGTHPPKGPRRSLAVVGFQNLVGRADAGWIATAPTEMLATDLASSERVRVISGDTVHRVKSDLHVADAGESGPEALGKMRTVLGVDYFVTGSYVAPTGEADAPVQLNLRLEDARTGQIVGGASESGSARDLASLVSDAVADLLRRPEWNDVAPKGSALKSYANPVSAKLYAEGLERSRGFDTVGARDLFKRAVEADPQNPLAHSAYGNSLLTLGYEELGRAEAKKAYDLSAALPREERLLVTGRYYAATNNWPQAVSTYKTLWDLFSDNASYGVKLASVQIDAGKPNDGLTTLQRIRNGGAAADLVEAKAARVQSDHARELASAKRAFDAASRTNTRLQLAEAYQHEGDALLGQQKLEEALAAFRSAEAIHSELDNPFGVASELLREALPYRLKGEYATFREYTEKAIQLFEQIGNRSAMGPALNNLALADRAQGNMLGALDHFEQSIAISRELGAKDNLSGSLNNAGNILRRINRQAEARRYFEECLSIAVELNNRAQIARSHITISSVDFDDGNLVSASDHIQQSLAIVNELKDERLKANVLQHVGDIKEAQGDLAGARSAYEESIAIARSLRAQQYIADGEVTVADIAREQGDFETAQRLWKSAVDYYAAQKQKSEMWEAQLIGAHLRIATGAAAGTEKNVETAAAGFHALKASARETASYALLAECYLAQHKIKQANAAIERGHAPFLETHEFQARAKYRLVAAKVRAVAGDRAGAWQELRALLSELESKNWSQLASEARLELAEIRS